MNTLLKKDLEQVYFTLQKHKENMFIRKGYFSRKIYFMKSILKLHLLNIFNNLDNNNYKNKGFLIAKIMKNGFNVRKCEYYMENFQYSNCIVISKNIINYL